jgi:rod shape-determining protein MreC
MSKRSVYPYLLLAILLFALWNMPIRYSTALRAQMATVTAPLWRMLERTRPATAESHLQTDLALLQAENTYLRTLVHQELALLEQLAALQTHTQELLPALERHRQMMTDSLKTQLEGIPARVLYRSPATWNSSLWLNVGNFDNAQLDSTVVAVNSPVMHSGSLVGVVDYVGERQCRVRLLTDVGLTPSVRAARGTWRDNWLSQQACLLQRQLVNRDDLMTAESKDLLTQQLAALIESLQTSTATWLLAKGELQGTSQPLWRRPGQALKGIGFNYDFTDEEGPARDLRTGMPYGQMTAEDGVPLIKVKDLLITTGYDGVFPAGLPVAEVTRIAPLGEGDYYYELEAEPCAGNLIDIDTVYVLPPRGFDVADQPPSVVW